MTESNRGWTRRIALPLGVVLITLLGLSCSESPTDQNSPTPPVELPVPTIRDTTIIASSDSTFKLYVPMDGVTNLIGSAEGYTALSVLEFYPSNFALRDTVNIVSATLRVRLSYRLGDASGPISFDVYRVTRAWNSATIRWDSVQSGFYDASTKRGSFSGTIASDSAYLTVDLDTAMVRQWISSTASADQKYGIILVPTPSSSIRGFVQFAVGDSISYYPTLQIIATNTSGTTRDTATYNIGMGTFVGDVTLPADPTVISVQSGVVYRSKLKFDLSFIPRGTTINSALLSLDVAPASTRLTSFTVDTNAAAHLDLSDDPSYILGGGVLLRAASGSFTTMTGDISGAVQSWVRGPNYGLVLRTSLPAETSRFDLYGFYGVRAPTAATRPRLKITYSLGKQ